ncbi:MAG: nitronate monooxygenase family protein [bacterium]|nr:nitronate monooxygenase family protein [bacterium]
MLTNTLSPLCLGDLVARIPIIQGGMGVGISLSRLASAVANEGGIGVIAAALIGFTESDCYSNYEEASERALRKEIQKARAASKGILGVNIMVALTNYADVVRTAIDEGIDVIFSGAGIPLNLPSFRKPDTKTKLVPIVSSGRAATILCKRWTEKYNYPPDAIVVEGPQAGGHLGFKLEQIGDEAYALEKLVPEVVEAVRPFAERAGKPIPVIAAGGIYTGADIRKYLELGASGVQMATRFVATHECDASDSFKQAYLDAKQEDIQIIESPVGMPGRVIRNKFTDSVGRGEKMPLQCAYHCIITCDYKNSQYCIAHALTSAQKGNFKSGFPFAGSNVYRVNKIVSVKELIDSLIEEYRDSYMQTAIA